jgi:hypothetical protein
MENQNYFDLPKAYNFAINNAKGELILKMVLIVIFLKITKLARINSEINTKRNRLYHSAL